MDIWILRVTLGWSLSVCLGDVVEGADVSPMSVGVVKIQKGVMWLLVFNKVLLLS